MPFFPDTDENAFYFSMFDEEQHWCRTTEKPFQLENIEWPSLEHYFQAMRFNDEEYRRSIASTGTPEAIKKLKKSWFKSKRKDWKQVRTTVMTRGLYMQCQMYPEMAQALLQTEDKRLVENSLYDYFWGCGRDRRGENQYGKVLMNIRAKLQQDGHAKE